MKIDIRDRWDRDGRRAAPHFLSAAAIALAIGASAPAAAADITFAVIGPHEYELPVNFKPFNVFVQYGEFNDGSRQFDDTGHVVRGHGPDMFVGLSKYVHFWSFDRLPGVGFAYEVIQPEVHVTGPGPKPSGLGDTLTGPAIWFKPSARTTLGLQSFLQVPDGQHSVTNHDWADYTSLFFDVEEGRFGVTGDLGAVFRSNRHRHDAPDVDEGTSYHLNVRASYRATRRIEPFVSVDWQETGKSRLVDSTELPFSHQEDTALGAGMMIHLGKADSFTLRYSRSVEGRNVPLTNAAYLKFVHLW